MDLRYSASDEKFRSELRAWLVTLAQAAYQGIGHRRTKNPRIWSLHDIDALSGPRG